MQTFIAYITIAYKVFVQNKKATQQLIEELRNFLGDTFELSPAQINRIYFYTAQSTITNSWFSSLRGYPANPTEQRSALLIGALTPLFDDLTDEMSLTSHEILSQIEKKATQNQSLIPLIQYIYKDLMQNVSDGFQKALLIAMQAQDESLKQLEGKRLSIEELKRISYGKGSTWTLLYRKVLRNPLLEGEEEAINQLGYLLQLTNDVFDVFKDYQNGQQTVFTNNQDIRPLYAHYQSEIESLRIRFQQLPYPSKAINNSWTQISTILGRGLVCFEQFLQCQMKTQDQFLIDQYTRKELICDMEKPRNMWRSFQLSKKISKQH